MLSTRVRGLSPDNKHQPQPSGKLLCLLSANLPSLLLAAGCWLLEHPMLQIQWALHHPFKTLLHKTLDRRNSRVLPKLYTQVADVAM